MHQPSFSAQGFGKVLLLLLALVPSVTKAQQFSITAGTINTCQGVLEDSGGPASPYNHNENFTVVICPDVPGDVISLQWTVWGLSNAGTQNSLDRIRIWDGNSNTATSLGEYTGNDNMTGLTVMGTTFNTSGCLTVQFTSNGIGVGNFAAVITCTTPCDRPTAVATMSEAGPALLCIDEPISFDGSGSFAAPGFGLTSYTWNFDDGTSGSGPSVTHAFSEPGEYLVQLVVQDDNECVNANVVDLQVRVSTIPIFGGTLTSTEVCLGAEVVLHGQAEPTTWTDLPEANFGEPLALPDDVGIPFTSELNFTQFEPGQTLTDPNDLLSLCVSMEHSFMGDLALMVTCPNGQTMVLHQQGGGGTFLGDANDNDSGNNIQPGTCWDYCWAPNAPNPTWEASVQAGLTMPAPSTNWASSLIPGTYSSVQPWSNLANCPLNGTWTFTSTDLWAADNGTICGWSLNFDPSIIPDLSQFTPVINTTDPDSANWSGPGISTQPGDPSNGTAVIGAPGSYDFTYSVTDNFGCTYDTTMTVVVNPPIQVNAGPDQDLCNNPVLLPASLTSIPPSGLPPMTYVWSPAAAVNNPSLATPTFIATTTTQLTVQVFPTGYPECLTSDVVTVNVDPTLDPGLDGELVLCASSAPFDLFTLLGGTPATGGVWTNSAGATLSSTFTPLTAPSGTYRYTVTNSLGCTAFSEVQIEVIPLEDPICCGVVDAGPDSVVCILSYSLAAIPGPNGVGQWEGPPEAVFVDALDPNTLVTVPSSGRYTFYWHQTDGPYCDIIDSVHVTLTTPMEIALAWTDAICFDACDGTATATVTGGNDPASFHFAWSGNVASSSSNTATGLCDGSYSLVVNDTNACSANAEYVIAEPVLLEIDSIRSVITSCFGFCDGQVVLSDPEAVLYSFDGGNTYGPNAVLDTACMGLYQVAIKNIDDCIGRGVVLVPQPPEVIADFTWWPEPVLVSDPVVHFTNTSVQGVTYSWQFGTLGTSQLEDPVFTFPYKYGDMYEVCMQAYDANQCVDSVCIPVIVHEVLQTFLPNAFTPNGDGFNDLFGLLYNVPDMADFTLRVFDRWGKVVWQTSDPDGKWDGGALPPSTFVWKLNYRNILTDTGHEKSGHVTLLR